jgi:hypothetical protein
MLFALLFFVAFSGVVRAAILWDGTWSDPILGGEIKVCTDTDDSGIVWGQGVMSNVGYMRGTINTDNVWSGSVIFPGQDVPTGSFTYTLTNAAPNPNTFVVTSFSVKPFLGNTQGSLSGTQSSTDSPSDQECFKTSMNYINKDFNYTGTFTNSDQSTLFYNKQTGSTFDSSYVYQWTGTDGHIAKSYVTGPILSSFGGSVGSSQINPGTWFEEGSTEGIELSVMKDDTSYYYLWWYITSMYDFDYSTKNQGSNYGVNTRTRHTADPILSPYGYECYELNDSVDEVLCLDEPRKTTLDNLVSVDDSCLNSSDDDKVSKSKGVLVSILVFAILIFVSLSVALLMSMNIKRIARPMATSENKDNIELSDK